MRRALLVASLVLAGVDAAADPPPPPAQTAPPHVAEPTAHLDLAIPAPQVHVAARVPRLDWAPAPQPAFGMFTASVDGGGGVMTTPTGTPLVGGGWEVGLSGGWGPSRFAELRLRASFFDQPDRTRDANGDQQDDVDERNLLGALVAGGLRLRLPLYAGIDEGRATRFVFFGEGLVGWQALLSYGDAASSGAALEVTTGVQVSNVRRRDGLTRGMELFVRYRHGLDEGNGESSALLFGLGYATEWSAYVPRVPPPEPVHLRAASPRPSIGAGVSVDPASTGAVVAAADGEARGHGEVERESAEPPGDPLGFNLHMGGDGGAGEGLWAAKTVGWSPWRPLILELETAYFTIDHSPAQATRDAPNVQGLFAGVGPRLHLFVDNGLRLGVWASARVGWAQVVSAPEGRDGTGLALNLAVGLSIGAASHPYRAADFHLFVARQTGITGNDDDVGMLYGGIGFDYQLGPHAPPRAAPEPFVARPAPVLESAPARAAVVEPLEEPRTRTELVVAPVEEPVEEPRTRTELVLVPLRPARPWPVGFAIGAELGWSYFPRALGPRFENGGLALGLGIGFVASPTFEVRSRVGLLTRSDTSQTGGDDLEALTLSAGPRVRIPIRTVKDDQVALILEALGGWVSTTDPAGTTLGSGPMVEGAVGVRLPARAGLTVGARGLWALSDATRDLSSVQLTVGGELEMGPRFRRPVVLPEIPRAEVPGHVEVEVGVPGDGTHTR